MPVSEQFLNYVIDQLSSWGEVSARRMFGGAGLYREGKMFALIAGDVAYLKADDSFRPDFEQRGCGPFRPWEHKKMTMPYYEIPADVLEDPKKLARWAERSFAIGSKTKKKK